MSVELPWLVQTRRAFHRIPEYAFHELKTSALIRKIIEEHDLGPVKSLAGTGLSFDVGTGEAPVLAFRADIDGLRITEIETERNRDYRSRHEGMMHACGHDAHITVALGVARALALDEDLRASLKGTVRFFFQPAEEVGGGALRMIEDGVLEDPRVDILLGLHVSPSLEAGTLACLPGKAFASCDRFEITINGRGAHGSQPEASRDPITAAAFLVTQLQTIVSRNVGPKESAVVSVCRFEGGKSFNVIPDKVLLEGTVRALDAKVRNRLEERVKNIVSACGQMFDLPSPELVYKRDTPVGFNDPDLVAQIRELALENIGDDCWKEVEAQMGAEDFAFYTLQLDGSPRTNAPKAAFIRLGCRNNEEKLAWDGKQVVGLHNHAFDFDEHALAVGCRLFLAAVRKYLT